MHAGRVSALLLLLATGCPRSPLLPATATAAAPVAAESRLSTSLEPAAPVSAMSADSSTYPMPHASPLRDSAQPVGSRARGVVSWSRPLGIGARDAAVLVWEGEPVVVGDQAVVLFAADGTRRWDRDGRRLGSPVVVANGLLHVWTGLELQTLDRTGAIVGADVAGACFGGEGIEALWPRDDEVLAVNRFLRAEDVEVAGETVSTQTPGCEAVRCRREERFSEWSASFDGTLQLPPLFVAQRRRLVLAVGRDVHVVDPFARAQPEGASPAPATFRRPSPPELNAWPAEYSFDWSADRAGNIALLALSGGRRLLTVFDLEGRVLWRWDDGGSDAWVPQQPPARGADGRIYALTARRVLAFDNGRLVRAHPVESPSRATVLADNSLLVTAGKRLLRLDAAGRTLFSLELPAPARGAPVAGPDGAIYVATDEALVRVD